MLGKLIKYEFKACGRTFLPLYISIILMSLIVGFSMNMNLFKIQGIAMVVLFGLFVALVVMTIMITIQRFRKNLLDDEGYLMFTLPVSSKQLIFSKYIVSFIYALLSVLVSVFSFLIMVFIMNTITYGIVPFSEIFYGLSSLFDMISPIKGTIILMLLLAFVSYSMFILILYFSVSMGQLPVFNKHRNIVAFISFFAVNIGINSIYGFVVNLISNFIDTSVIEDLILNSFLGSDEIANSVTGIISSLMGFNLGFYIIIVIAIFFGISYILDKKLNLE